jgi:hypothetical protein
MAGWTRSCSTYRRVQWPNGADGRYGPATMGPSAIKNQLWLPAVVGFFAFIKSGDLICDRKASYRAKNAASTSPGLRHLGSARRGLSPNSQALARVYKTFACRTSSGTIAARGSRTRRFRAHSAVCLINTNKSGKCKPSRPPIDAVAIGSPPFGNEAAPCATARKYPS